MSFSRYAGMLNQILATADVIVQVLLETFFFITLKPRVERYAKSMSVKYEPASEPLRISVK